MTDARSLNLVEPFELEWGDPRYPYRDYAAELRFTRVETLRSLDLKASLETIAIPIVQFAIGIFYQFPFRNR